MIPNCRKVLKSINYLCQDGESTSMMDIMVFFNNHIRDLDLSNTLVFLKNKGYITFPDDNKFLEISVTYEGRHYREFSVESIKRFLFRSLVVPIIVSMFTTIVTVLVTQLLT